MERKKGDHNFPTTKKLCPVHFSRKKTALHYEVDLKASNMLFQGFNLAHLRRQEQLFNPWGQPTSHNSFFDKSPFLSWNAFLLLLCLFGV